MDFNKMSKDEIIKWMSVNLSTKQLEECLKNKSETISKTPTLSKSKTPTLSKSKTPTLSKSKTPKSKSKSPKSKNSGVEETKNTSTPPTLSQIKLDSAKKTAKEMCKKMKHITINSVVYKGKNKTDKQIRYNVTKEILKKSIKGGKGDKVAMTLTLAALKKECKSNNFGNKKQMENYLLKLMRPN